MARSSAIVYRLSLGAMVILSSGSMVIGDVATGVAEPLPPPTRVALDWPVDGDAAAVIDQVDGRRIRNLFAQQPQAAGSAGIAWDLRDDRGQFVAPGRYRLTMVGGPPVELHYQLTPYPNLQEFFPERTPWMTGHSGPNGWLSDHSPNWAIAALGDRLYVGSSMAEAGVTLIETDREGRRQWARHNFGAWQGVNQLAADADFLYILDTRQRLHRLDPETRRMEELFSPVQGPERRGSRSAMAARDGRIYMAYTGEPLFDNAGTGQILDRAHCMPEPPDHKLAYLLRMGGSPPGSGFESSLNPNSRQPQGTGQLWLESTVNALPPAGVDAGDMVADLLAELDHGIPDAGGDVQYAVIAFTEPIRLGSLVFPHPGPDWTVTFSTLRTDAPYPPRPGIAADWVPFEEQSQGGWDCVPAPRQTLTRALRIAFEPVGRREPPWFGRLEGLRLLDRRFRNWAGEATIRVNSGRIGPDGVWDAGRTSAVAPDDPGIYLMEWDAPRTLAGLAIREIQGAVTEIDVWHGPAAGPVPLEGPAHDRRSEAHGWRHVATYRQDRRKARYRYDNNMFARYLDGYVAFPEPVVTPAVRLRVVEPWIDNGPGDDLVAHRHDGRSEHGMHIRDSYIMQLDSRLCRIHGVAALELLEGAPARDPLAYERLEVWNAATGELEHEVPVRLGWHGLAFGPDGALFAIDKSHQTISAVDIATGTLTPVVTDAAPHTFTIGPDGAFYVRSWRDQGRGNLAVYDRQGRLLRTIGNTGGFQPGPWDPQRFGNVHRLLVDDNDSLWVLESQQHPRRIVQYRTDGTFVKELLGNTQYGGGGTLDALVPTRAYYQQMVFEIDWQHHRSRLAGLLGDAFQGGKLVALEVDGRHYLVSTPENHHDRQAFGVVYRYDPATGTVRMLAAAGDAAHFKPLRSGAIISMLEGRVPQEFAFLWSDLNGDGRPDPDEVQFFPKEVVRHTASVGPFDRRLGLAGAGSVYYRVERFTAEGVPVYTRAQAPRTAHYRLAEDRWLSLHGVLPGREGTFNALSDAAGQPLWHYPAHGGVSGLSIAPWEPGRVGNQFGIIGHATGPAEGLGEFFVIHDNTGQWRIWTADGIMAGNLLYHQADRRARRFGPPEAPPGELRLDPLTASQEHFHGFFTRTADGRDLIVAGFTYMSLIEVKGLDRFHRASAEFVVTEDDIARTREWEASRAEQRRETGERILSAQEIDMFEGHPPLIDGVLGLGALVGERREPGEWPEPITLPGNPDIGFRMAYDTQTLYLCWTARGEAPLRNSGEHFRTLFRTGAALDFYLGTDPGADPRRTQPAAGDLRLVLTLVEGQPRVVLYQPIAPGADPGEGWSTYTEAAGSTAFDRVVVLEEARMAVSGGDFMVAEVAIPLEALGLRPESGMRLRMDWGFIASDDGFQVRTRQYWSNSLATGTADEAVEARLEPHLWGTVEF